MFSSHQFNTSSSIELQSTCKIAGGYFETGKGAQYYVPDRQGNNVGVIDNTGKLVESTTYYPYGEPTEEPDGQRFLYGGKEREHGGGRNSYDFSARCLIAPLGQWCVPDRKAEKYYSYSPYSYCGGDPINYIDPDGNEVLCIRKNSKAAKNFPDNGNLIILAHGDFNGIYDEFSDKYITSASDFISLINEKTNNYKDIESNNKFAYIELLSCHAGENQTNTSTPFAQKLSESLKNVVIKAPNGVLNIGINTKRMRVTPNYSGLEDTANNIKYWRYFFNGDEITDVSACFIQMLINMEIFLNDNIDKFINLFDEIHNPKD